MITKRLILVGLGSLMCCLQGVYAAVDSSPAVRGAVQMSSTIEPLAVAGCPNQGGLLDSVSVQVGEPLELFVVTDQPAPEGGVVLELSSGDPSVVAAGDPLQGFLPRVFVPEGDTKFWCPTTRDNGR